MRKIFAGICLFFSVIFCLQSQGLKQAVELAEIMEQNEIPGISLTYIESGEIKLETGQGKKNDTETVDQETVFSAASLSKPIFAYIVMQLVEEGTLELDRPLHEYYEYPDVANEKRHLGVTAKMILSHTSGLPNWRKKKLKFLFEPGEKYSYSGEGYVWLQRVVEHLKGKRLDEIAQEYVFGPLDMKRSGYVFRPDFEDNYSISYKKNGESREKNRIDQENAAASLQTTGGDYAKFLKALLSGDAISDETRELMFTPVKTTQPKEDDPKIFWGLGVGIQITENGPQIFQWGDNWTFRGFFTANISTKDAVVYLTNSENGLIPLREIVGTFMDDPQPAADWLNYK
ncbi:serine hydrolase domain-containing protein [Algoriphagus sediminis]|uniref:Serine hydrolase domain-containing protein n=1 Tax=Algoriphagus sediminis TaxID=3057113 RepID=A0ABT7YGF6_9BACT|nr:serine hydrolase domain-containing protein [Algoriphagus sediminis]MDN3205587.1 serine hydrolase domain-containing protein [Algoriphagus sediminis]